MMTNYIPITMSSKKIFKYELNITQGDSGELPEGQFKLSRRIWAIIWKDLSKDYGESALFAGRSFYSTINVAEDKEYTATLRERKKKVEEVKEDTPSMAKETHTEETTIAETSAKPDISEDIYKVWIKFTKAIEPEDQENLTVIKMQVEQYFLH